MASHATGDGGIPLRDATKRGLKRIMTLGGAYGIRNDTIKDLPILESSVEVRQFPLVMTLVQIQRDHEKFLIILECLLGHRRDHPQRHTIL